MSAIRLTFVLSVVVAELVVFSILLQGDKRETDFPAFYSAAILWKSGANPYDIEKQCKLQSTLRPDSECLPFAHPPLLLPVVSFLSSANFNSSYWRWIAAVGLLVLLCSLPIYRLTRDGALTLQCLCFFPVLVGISQAQDSAAVLLGVVLFVLLRDRPVLAGLCLSLTVVKPQLAFLLAAPLLLSERRAFAGFLLGASAWTALSFALVSVEGLRGLMQIAQMMATTEGMGVSRPKMPNAVGLLSWLSFDPRLAWPFFIAGLVFIAWLWRKRFDGLSMSAGIVVALFVSPHTHMHDLALLIIPSVFTAPLALPIVASLLLIGVKFQAGPPLSLVAILALVYLLRSARRQTEVILVV